MGKFSSKKKKVVKKKSKKGNKDKDWSHEGGAFGAENDNGEAHAKPNIIPDVHGRKRRLTQGIQDAIRRGKLKNQLRKKDNQILRRLAPTEEPIPEPVMRRRKRKPKSKGAAAAKPVIAPRYSWLGNGKPGHQKVADDDGEEEAANDEQAEPDKGARKAKSAYDKLLSQLSDKSKLSSSKYRALIEQRRRDEEGMATASDTGSEGSEDEEEGDEDEEGEEGLVNGGRNGVMEVDDEDEDEDEEDEEEEEEEDLEQDEDFEDDTDAEDGEEEEEEMDASLAEGKEEDGDEEEEDDEDGETRGEEDEDPADSFVQFFERPPLSPASNGIEGVLVQRDVWPSRDVEGDGEHAEEEDEEEGISVHSNMPEPSPSRLPDLRQAPHLRKHLADAWEGANEGPTTELQARLYPWLSSYGDVFFAALTWKNLTQVQRVVLLHMCNHVIKARSRVLRHNLRRRKRVKATRALKVAQAIAREEGEEGEEEEGEGVKEHLADEEEAEQDQGYTRPRVLVLCPMRSNAFKLVKDMVAILGPRTSVIGMERLEESYGVPEGGEGKDEGGESTSKKPEEWHRYFDGNCDDAFKLGLSLTPGQGKGKGGSKGVAVKLFTEFYHSDIILASPLGLQLAMEEKRDSDFLSSLDMVIVEQADVLLMQNWDHVSDALGLMGKPPRDDHNTDFSRVRPYFLENQASRFRQNILLSRFLDPLLSAAFNKSCQSHAGKVRFKRDDSAGGSICQVALRVKQVFHRIPCLTLGDQGDVRLEYTIKSVLPELRRLRQTHTLFFVPSYFEFVRLRNHMVKAELSHACVSEYERTSETSRGRSRFFHGTRDMLLYTGRAHFFKRFAIRGARHLIFYGLPEYPGFHPELVNLLEEAEAHQEVTSCLVLFTRFEALALERIVGTERCRHMLTSEKSTFLFC